MIIGMSLITEPGQRPENPQQVKRPLEDQIQQNGDRASDMQHYSAPVDFIVSQIEAEEHADDFADEAE